MKLVLKIAAGIILAVVVLLGGCAALVANSTKSSDTDRGNSSQTTSPRTGDGADASPSAASSTTFKNGVLTTPDVKIKITRYKVIGVGQKGNEYGEKPVIAYWYKTTNVSGKKIDPMIAWIFSFKTYQDNNPNAENELNVASLPDERFLDSQSENIKKGGTVEDAVAYELDDLVTPVDLVATEGLDNVIGKTTYKLS
jgi:hypothetical protein